MKRRIPSLLTLLLVSLLHAETTRAQASAWLWALPPATNTLGISRALKVALDSLGNAYVLGQCDSAASVGAVRVPAHSTFVTKLNGLGQVQWAVSVGNRYEYATALTADAAGNVYVAGPFYNAVQFGTLTLTAPSGSNAVYVAGLDAAGQWRWAAAALGGRSVGALALPPTGQDVWAAGEFTTTLQCGPIQLTNPPTGDPPLFVARLAATSGTWRNAWDNRVAGIGRTEPAALVTDDLGNAYVTGRFVGQATFGATVLSSPANASDCGFVVKLSAAGGWQWARQWGVRGSSAGGSILLLNGSLIVGGYYRAPEMLDSISLPGLAFSGLVAALNVQTGQWQWANQTSPATLAGPYISALTADASGTLYAAGGATTLFGNMVFGADTIHTPALFVASADGQTGQWRHAWQNTWQSTMSRGGEVTCLATRGAGEVVLTGSFGPTSPLFGPHVVPANPARNTAYVAKLLDPYVPTGLPPAAAEALALWPNPATGAAVQLRVPPTAGLREVRVLDALGRIVRLAPLPAGQAERLLPLADLPPGLYIVRCGEQARRLVVE